jgi:hypothetical protein
VRGRLVVLALTLALAGLGMHWAARAQSAPLRDEIGDEVQTVPRGRLPAFAGEGDTGALYRFATTRGDVLRYMPCTCGCAQVGHTSNRSCYVKAETDASVTYTSHAAT